MLEYDNLLLMPEVFYFTFVFGLFGFVKKIGKAFGKVGKGVAKIALKSVPNIIKRVPIVGSIAEVAFNSLRGSARRVGASANVAAQQETFSAAQFQTTRDVATGFGLGTSTLLSSPIFIIALLAGVALFFFRRKR